MYIANLQIKVDTTDLERAKKELEGLSQVAPKVRQSTDDVSKAYDEAGKGAEKLSKAGERLIARVQEQVATFGKAKEDVIAYKAGLLGVGDAVNPLVENLRKLKAQQQEAVSAQKAFVAENKAAAREQEKLSTAQDRMIASLKEEIALFGKSKEEILLYRAGLMGISDQVEPLIRELQRLKQAKEEESKAGVTSSSTRANKRELERKALADEAAELEKIIALERERIAASNAQSSTKPDATRTREAEAALESYTQKLNQVNQKQKEVDSSADQLGDEYLKLKYSIDPVAKSLDDIAVRQSRLKELFRSGKLDIPRQEYETLNASLEASRKRINDLGATTGKTAKEINFALRGLPAQFTDIFVSLQAGQAPLTVFLQQGGQLKDMFGGIGPAARAMGGYIMGLINPYTLAAAAVGALGIAWFQGQKEADAYRLAIVSTGNAAGVSVDGLGRMAQSVGEITGNVGQAAEALALLAANSKIDSSVFEDVARAVVGWSKVSGEAVEDLIKEFSKIGEDPVEGVVELNKKYNFLTEDIYSQILALEKQGDTQGAVALATNELAKTHEARTKEMMEHLGFVERGWNALKGAVSNFWDFTKGVGRDTLQDKIEEQQRKVNELFSQYATSTERQKKDLEETLKREQAHLALLQEEQHWRDLAAAAEGERNRQAQQNIEITNELSKEALKAQSQADQLRAKLAEYEKNIQTLRDRGVVTIQDENNYQAIRAKLLEDIAKAEQGINRITEERASAADRLLASIRERGAVLSASLEKESKLTKEQTELEKLQAQFATLKEQAKTRTLTKEEQSILANEELIIAAQKRNILLETERTTQDAIAKIEVYRANLNSRLLDIQRKYQDVVMGAGRGKRELEQLRERNALQEEYRKQLERIEDTFAKSDGGEAARKQYEGEKAALDKHHREVVVAWEQHQRDLERIRGDWRNGASAAWADYLDEVRDVAGQTYSLFSKAFKGIEDYIVSFISGTKSSFKDLVKSLAADLARLGVRNLVGSLFGGNNNQGGGGLLGSLFGGGGSGGGGWGNLASLARGVYSVYNAITGVGSEILSGWSSGGFSGALSNAASYYGGIIENVYSTVAGWFGQTAATSATSAASSMAAGSISSGYTGQAMANWIAAQTTNTTTMGSILGKLTSTLSNPYTWIASGLIASWKLYDQGVRADGSAINDKFRDSGSSGLARGFGGVLSGASYAVEFMDKLLVQANKILLPIGSALLGDKLTAVITGSPVTQAVNMALARLFGGGERFQRQVGSAAGTFSGGEYVGTGAVESWFNGERRFGDDFDAALHNINQAFGGALSSLFAKFDIDSAITTETVGRIRRTSGKLLAGITVAFEDAVVSISGQYSKDGRIEAGLQQFFDDVMGRGMVEAIAASKLPEYIKELTAGLVTAEDVSNVLGGLFQRFEGVNNVVEMLNFNIFELSDAGLRGADALLDLVSAIAELEDPTTADKLQALSDITATYYDKFFTDAEKLEHTILAVTRTFEQNGVALAATREGFRESVENIDLTTEAGRRMFATMMQLAGHAASYYDALEQTAAQAAQLMQTLLMGNVDASFARLQRSIQTERNRLTKAYQEALEREQAALDAQIEAHNAAADAASENVSKLRSIEKALASAFDKLVKSSATATAMLREQSVQMLRDALLSARSGTSLATFEGVEDAIAAAAEINPNVYGSFVDFEREQARTANLISDLQKLNTEQLTTEEQLLKNLKDAISVLQKGSNNTVNWLKLQYERDIAALDREMDMAQRQLDALNGIDNSILSVGEAMRQLSEAITNALNANGQGQAELIDKLYQSILGIKPNQQGVDYWSGVIGNSNNYAPLIDALNDAAQGRAATQTYIEDAYKQYGFSVDAEGMRFWTEALAEGVYTFNDLIQGLKSLRGYSTGGYISGAGTSTSDSILARLSDGEFVMRASAVDKYGVQTLQAMNEGKLRGFSGGGYVSVANTSALSASDGNIVKTVFEKVVSYLDEIRQYSRQTTKNTSSAADSLRTQNEVGVVVRG